MKKIINFNHCSSQKFVRELSGFSSISSTTGIYQGSNGLFFDIPNHSARPILNFHEIKNSTESFEVYVRFKVTSVQTGDFSNIGGGVILCSSTERSTQNGIKYVFDGSATALTPTTTVLRGVDVNGSETVTTFPISSPTPNNYQNYRNMLISKNGTTYKYKIWYDGVDEPEFDAGITHGNGIGFCGFEIPSRGGCCLISMIGIGTNGDAAPRTTPNITYVRGVLYDPDDNAVPNYEVRIYHAYTGRLLTSTITGDSGVYMVEIDVPVTEKVLVCAVDSQGNEWRPNIYEVYPKVINY